MSTKIYDAYKVNNLSITEVVDKLKKIKHEYHEKAHQFLMTCDKDKLKENYGDNYIKLYDTLREHARKQTNDVFNWTASVMLYFHQDDIYIQFFGLSFRLEPNIEEIFEGNLQDFHYQNQTDEWWCYESDNYTEEEIKGFEEDWANRQLVWGEIFGDEWVPAKCGLTYIIYDENDAFDVSMRYFKEIGELQ